MPRRRLPILGVAVDDVTEDEALVQIAALLASGGIHQICTVNPEFVVEAGRNPAFAHVLAHASLCTPDGVGLLLAARYLGYPLRGRVTGVELTRRLAGLAAQGGHRLFLLGAAPGVAEDAAAVLRREHPSLLIAGCYAGSPAPRHEPFLRQLIRATQPAILLVAYGHPQQDLWIARNQALLGVPIALGVGGTFDYIAGRVPRAPRWLRRIGLEWLYRLVRQPRRLPRIIDAVPRFAWQVVRNRGTEEQDRRTEEQRNK
ncbi:MAG: WecB/TagA/CpsF family glycosyltransferase [Candidatus Viridilinea halotolerans]|uniref:WecB/TagA/CpsF family glycosyltransferase n=1 Tax=Candidatus Viridilinea halotolerans TaxID=2491704 RepID=A0A426U3H6_9CHLR|nr:MAG: WecB/TagA/CpsF family glycosyltransferase [Candidatus Viridilinea halotolerans]